GPSRSARPARPEPGVPPGRAPSWPSSTTALAQGAVPSTRRSIPHRPASEWRTTFVTASRTTQARAFCVGAGSSPSSVVTDTETPADPRSERAPASSAARSGARNPATSSRISRKASSAIWRTSSISLSAPGRPRLTSSAASSLLTATVASVRPKVSCRSREKLRRASATARRASTSRRRSCSQKTRITHTETRVPSPSRESTPPPAAAETTAVRPSAPRPPPAAHAQPEQEEHAPPDGGRDDRGATVGTEPDGHHAPHESDGERHGREALPRQERGERGKRHREDDVHRERELDELLAGGPRERRERDAQRDRARPRQCEEPTARHPSTPQRGVEGRPQRPRGDERVQD